MTTIIEFNEVQRLHRWWIWLAVLALNGLIIYAIVQQVILGIPFGNKPAPDGVLFLIEFFMLLLLLFVFSIRLKTSFNEKGIFYRYYPFQFKTTCIAWEELNDAYIREYNSFYEYGGWGIRPGTQKAGGAINTSASSRRGLQLQFKDGKLLLIGTSDPDSIQGILDQLIAEGLIQKRV